MGGMYLALARTILHARVASAIIKCFAQMVRAPHLRNHTSHRFKFSNIQDFAVYMYVLSPPSAARSALDSTEKSLFTLEQQALYEKDMTYITAIMWHGLNSNIQTLYLRFTSSVSFPID